MTKFFTYLFVGLAVWLAGCASPPEEEASEHTSMPLARSETQTEADTIQADKDSGHTYLWANGGLSGNISDRNHLLSIQVGQKLNDLAGLFALAANKSVDPMFNEHAAALIREEFAGIPDTGRTIHFADRSYSLDGFLAHIQGDEVDSMQFAILAEPDLDLGIDGYIFGSLTTLTFNARVLFYKDGVDLGMQQAACRSRVKINQRAIEVDGHAMFSRDISFHDLQFQ